MEPFDLRKWKGFIAAGGNASHNAVVEQITIDSRRIYSPHSLFVALKGKKVDAHQFVRAAAEAGAKYALVFQNWDSEFDHPHLSLLRVEDPLRSLQEISQAYRANFACKVIAIAGSYGKTMVKDLLHAFLSTKEIVVSSPESFNSQLGVALSLLTIKKDTTIALIEAGVSQIGEMDILSDIIAPDCCILTHIGRKHLTTLGSLENSVGELAKLAKKVPIHSWVLLPENSLFIPHFKEMSATKHYWNSKEAGLPYVERLSPEKTQLTTLSISFPEGIQEKITYTGPDYTVDLLNLTIKPAWLLGISANGIISTLKNYIPEPMRTEIWQSPFGTTFINEPYSSDPLSIDRSLNHFKHCPAQGKKIYLFGGLRGENKDDRSYDYARIGKAFAGFGLDKLLLIGNHSYESLILETENSCIPSKHPSYKEAIAKLKDKLNPQDLVVIKGDSRFPLDDLTESFHGSIFPNQCYINLAAIEANLATITHKLGHHTRRMIMVKAFGYGMNDVRIAQFLSDKGIDILGVSYVDEGIALKRAGITQSLFSLHASPYEAEKVAEWGLEVGVSDSPVIAALADASARRRVRIKLHLHVDTGMSRLGCRLEEALPLAKEILKNPSLQLEGIMTHFSSADDPREDAFTHTQIERFNSVIASLEQVGIEIPWKHAANSSAMMRFSLPQCNMARIGLALYGLNPSKEAREALDLRPAVTLTSRIVGINQCKKGDSVSYGRHFIIDQDHKRIAVIPIGYYDGIHRNYSGKGKVIVQGKKADIVGNICMDFMMVDITDIPNASINDPVLLFGEDTYGNTLSPEEFAAFGNSIPHELITCLGPRIQRIFIHEETQKSC